MLVKIIFLSEKKMEFEIVVYLHQNLVPLYMCINIARLPIGKPHRVEQIVHAEIFSSLCNIHKTRKPLLVEQFADAGSPSNCYVLVGPNSSRYIYISYPS